MNKFVLYTDGGSRGNPGPAAGGFVISDADGFEIMAKGVFLGNCTNNVAEYGGLISGLEMLKEAGAKNVEIFCDSQLMVRQVNGQYRVKSPNLKPSYKQVMELLESFDKWSIEHVYRDSNERADEMANLAMDKKQNVQQGKMFLPSKSDTKKLRIGILVSGGGRTMLNIQDCIDNGQLNAEIAVVICSREKIKGYERAKNMGIDTHVVKRMDFEDIDRFSEKLGEILKDAKVDIVVQAGWLCLWQIPSEFENAVMNIHPALLPSFGGKGMWGNNVHQAVIDRGCKISGCTVHFCNNQYDQGPIIIQRSCTVSQDDDADSLAARVFEQECIAYPEAIKLFAENKLKIENGIVHIKHP